MIRLHLWRLHSCASLRPDCGGISIHFFVPAYDGYRYVGPRYFLTRLPRCVAALERDGRPSAVCCPAIPFNALL